MENLANAIRFAALMTEIHEWGSAGDLPQPKGSTLDRLYLDGLAEEFEPEVMASLAYRVCEGEWPSLSEIDDDPTQVPGGFMFESLDILVLSDAEEFVENEVREFMLPDVIDDLPPGTEEFFDADGWVESTAGDLCVETVTARWGYVGMFGEFEVYTEK